MTRNELNEHLIAWIDSNGMSDDSFNNFANVYATSYEEYMAIWEILNEIER
jgi:pantothenate kinase-related protein Tda10